jgi:hypothetical protein
VTHEMIDRVYWVSTGLLSALMVLNGILDLLHVQPFVETIRLLGYPDYLLTILGVAKLLGAPVLLYPGAPRLKEWAYAGFAFDFGGAAISLALSGALVTETLPSIFCGSLLTISYFTYRHRARHERFDRMGAVPSLQDAGAAPPAAPARLPGR